QQWSQVKGTGGEGCDTEDGRPDADPACQMNMTFTISPQNIDEGDTATVSGTVVHPMGFPFVTSIDWGDGNSPEVVQVDEYGIFVVDHVYIDEGAYGYYDVSLTMDDGWSTYSESGSVAVNNAEPTVILNIASSVFENDSVTATGTVSDPGILDIFTTIEIDWGDGTQEPVTLDANGNYNMSHVYVDDEMSGTPSDDYYVFIWATDDDLGYGEAWGTVTVNNVAPVLTLNAVATVNEGQQATLSGTITDVSSLDEFDLTIDWGDGYVETYYTVPAGAFSYSYTYADDPPGIGADTYTIQVTVVDDDTGTDSKSTDVTVNNVNPVVTLDPVSDVNEGDSSYVSGTVTDPGVYDTHTVTIDWGDGHSEEVWVDGSGFFEGWHTYEDDDPTATASDIYSITATVEDDDTGTDSDSASFTVNNVAPTLYYTDYYWEITDGIELTVEGSFDDVWADSHTLTIDWGDGTSDVVNYDAGGGSGSGSGLGMRSFTLTHNYIDPNPDPDWEVNYSYSITVEDDDLGESTGSGSGSVTGGSGSGSGGSSGGSGSGGGSGGSGSGGGSALIFGGQSGTTKSDRLRVSEVVPLFHEAVRRWDALTDRPIIERTLREVVVQIADLPDEQLGFAVQNSITIDLNAAGVGWFLDPTPGDEVEFVERRDGEFRAHRRSEAHGGIDLLTVLMHELGHVLGFGHSDDRADLMNDSLDPGVRRVPDTAPTRMLSPHPTTGESITLGRSQSAALGRFVVNTPGLTESVRLPRSTVILESDVQPLTPPTRAIHRYIDAVFSTALESDDLALFE
ncbi:MAG: matrixin family metalloprotease, partial [Planctomycetaceae bacterium]|nr:matrixin family metalloprotease [Planctomycetaceae bacterium]